VVQSLVGCVPLVVLIPLIKEEVPSRINEMPITMISGAQAVRGLMGEMTAIDMRMEMIRK
jgi:hypothetical protein